MFQVVVHSNVLLLRSYGDQPVGPIEHPHLEIRTERVGFRSVSLIILLVQKGKCVTVLK